MVGLETGGIHNRGLLPITSLAGSGFTGTFHRKNTLSRLQEEIPAAGPFQKPLYRDIQLHGTPLLTHLSPAPTTAHPDPVPDGSTKSGKFISFYKCIVRTDTKFRLDYKINNSESNIKSGIQYLFKIEY
jgi:hypothetical protein